MNIKYDVPFEVTKAQYNKVIVRFSQLIAHRIVGGKYYIKLWFMQYKPQLIEFLNNN